MDNSQGSSLSSVSSEAVAAGGSATDDRMHVGQSSASEADLPDDGSSDQGSVDEETLLCSPSQEMESEAGTAAPCSAQTTTSGTACETKCKQDFGPKPKLHKEQKNMQEGLLLEVTLNRLKKTAC